MNINPITPRTETVTIYQGDDDEEIRHLKAQIDAASGKQARASRTLDEPESRDVLVERHNALVAEAESRAVKIVLRAVGRKTWRDLVAKHPPRPDSDTDKEIGVNDDTFGDDLVPACIASPEGARSEAFLDSLSSAQFNDLYAVAFFLNRGSAPAPKALPSESAQN